MKLKEKKMGEGGEKKGKKIGSKSFNGSGKIRYRVLRVHLGSKH